LAGEVYNFITNMIGHADFSENHIHDLIDLVLDKYTAFIDDIAEKGIEFDLDSNGFDVSDIIAAGIKDGIEKANLSAVDANKIVSITKKIQESLLSPQEENNENLDPAIINNKSPDLTIKGHVIRNLIKTAEQNYSQPSAPVALKKSNSNPKSATIFVEFLQTISTSSNLQKLNEKKGVILGFIDSNELITNHRQLNATVNLAFTVQKELNAIKSISDNIPDNLLPCLKRIENKYNTLIDKQNHSNDLKPQELIKLGVDLGFRLAGISAEPILKSDCPPGR